VIEYLSTNEFYNNLKLKKHPKHYINKENINYHYDNIFDR